MRLRIPVSPTLAVLALSLASIAQAVQSPAAAPRAASVSPTLVFVANQGQISGAAQYYALQAGGAVYFESGTVVLDRAPRGDADLGLVVRVTFPNHEEDMALRAAELQRAQVSSYVGNDPAGWRAALPTFGEVRYEGIARGADLVYRVQDGKLKYDVLLATGADLRGVRLRYEGVQSLEIDPSGELVLHSDAGDLREAAPVLYQESEGRRVRVEGGYRKVSDAELGFWATAYDPSLPLVVDPSMIWSSFLGGDADDFANGIAADAAGNLIVVGSTSSSDYPTTSGAYRRTLAGPRDVFVTKLRADGTGLLWSTYLGGSDTDEAKSLFLDANGYIYLCGRTGSTDFPVTSGAFQRTHGGGLTDGFVAKLAPNGSSLTFCTLLGGAYDDYAAAIAVNHSGNPTVAGVTGSGDFPTTPGVVRPEWTPTFFDGTEGFVAKLNSEGSGLVYSTFVGGGSVDGISGLAIDREDQPIVVGNTKSSSFPTTAGALRVTLGGAKDGFVTCLNSDATAYFYSTYLGGGDLDVAIAVGLDGSGNAYVTGYTTSNDFPTTTGALQRTFAGGGDYDGFVCKLTPDGNSFSLSYGTYLGGNAQDIPLSLAVTSDGLASLTGYTSSSDFPTTPGAFDATANGGDDAFVAAVAPDGRSLWYSSYLGSAGTDNGYSITPAGAGHVAVCGSTTESSFPTTRRAYDRTHGSPGALDGFVAVFDIGAAPTVDAGDSPQGRLSLAAPQPSPFAAHTLLRLTLSRPSPVEVVVLDIRGRAVATIARGELPAGQHAWTWDGRGDDGAPVASGLYWVQASSAENRLVRRVVRLR